jgi:hypothetical protein
MIHETALRPKNSSNLSDILAKSRAIVGSSDKQAICAAYWLVNGLRALRAFRLWELTYPQPNN